MELVAAAKMRRAQQQAISSETYAGLSWELIKNLSRKTDPRLHKLLWRPKEITNVAIVLMTSNRGLIGGFNNNIINTACNYAQAQKHIEFITLGKKGEGAVRKRGFRIAAVFEKKDTATSALDIRSLAKLLIGDFVNGKYDRVVLAYMDFVSTLRQRPDIRELLPLTQEPPQTPEIIEAEEEEADFVHDTDYLFEPTPDDVLEILLPRLVEIQIYQALLETNASEHSARMVAMKNASDAAADLVNELTLDYNQIRQETITKEISEIVASQLVLQH